MKYAALAVLAAMSLSACDVPEEEAVVEEGTEEVSDEPAVDQDDVTLGVPKDVQQKTVSEDPGVDQELP
jgi:hypothetical protein